MPLDSTVRRLRQFNAKELGYGSIERAEFHFKAQSNIKWWKIQGPFLHLKMVAELPSYQGRVIEKLNKKVFCHLTADFGT